MYIISIILFLFIIIYILNNKIINDEIINDEIINDEIINDEIIKDYDCIISINVHEKFNFLLKQLKNIKDNVKCKYAVILNCNDYMFDECNKNILPNNVYIHPTILNKKWSHGSLTNGIYNNITFAINHFTFKFFIVSSSRNMFINDLTLDKLNIVKKHGTIPEIKDKNYEEWRWPSFKTTKLGEYYLSRGKELYNSPHEGLMFTYNGAKTIVNFLENNPIIKDHLFNYEECVEEFSLQTILINEGDMFYDIGNGCCIEQILGPNTDETKLKFMYKVIREEFINFFFE
jgi:hypothetical protein